MLAIKSILKLILRLLILSSALIMINPVFAYGTPTYIIYVSGTDAGTIEASGSALPFPSGACGMRLISDNVLAWYWAEGEYSMTGVLDIENNGWMPPPPDYQLTELIEFTGQFNTDCEGEYFFQTPATPTTEPPPGAIALVVQFSDPDEVIFLDHNFQIMEPPGEPEPGNPPPDMEEVCEEFPEICEPPRGSWVANPCNSRSWSTLCDLAVGLGGQTTNTGKEIESATLSLAALNSDPLDTKALKSARSVVKQALAKLPGLKSLGEAILREYGNRFTSAAFQRMVNHAFVSTDLAKIDLLQCQANLDNTLNLSKPALKAQTRDQSLKQSRQALKICEVGVKTLREANNAIFRLGVSLQTNS